MIKHTTGISGILFAAAMAGMPVPTFANDTPAQPTTAAPSNGQNVFCFDPNTRQAPRRIRNITRDNAVQIYDACLEAENWREAVQILTSEFDLGPNRWHAIDQILSIYDGKMDRQRELTTRLQDDARNPETGKKWKRSERRDFQAELLEVDGWLRTVNSSANMPALIQWRNANAPNVLSIEPIAGTQCQTEVRMTFDLQQSFMTCGTWRAPATGPLQYQFRVNYQSVPTAQPATAPAQP